MDAVPLLSPSIAHTLVSRSPLHAWQQHYLLGGAGVVDESTDAQERGKILDRMLFGAGPELVMVDAKDWRTNVAKEAREIAREQGKLAVLVGKFDTYKAIIAAAKAKMEAKGIHLTGQSQQRLLWTSDGVQCKGRPDHVIWADGLIYDLKTCENASPDVIARSMFNYGSDIQHAAYVEGGETLHPELAGRLKMKFVYCEVEPPYEVVVANVMGTMRALGAHRWQQAKESWKRCLETGLWPGYSEGEVDIEAQPWQLTDAVLPKGGSQGVTF